MKILVILERAWEAGLFAGCLHQRPEIQGQDCLIFAPCAEVQNELKRRGIPFTTELDYSFPEAAEGVTARSYYLAETWWKNFFTQVPCLNANGINIPALIERDAVYFFLWILRTVSFMQSLIDFTRPAEIWSGVPEAQETLYFRGGREESLYGGVAAGLAREKKIPVKIFKAPWPIRLRLRISSNMRKAASRIAGVRLRERLSRAQVPAWEYAKAFLRDMAAAAALRFFHRPVHDARPVLLISSSEAHVAPVVQELKKRGAHRLAYLRETFSPAQAAAFFRNGESFSTVSIPKTAGPAASGLQKFWAQHASQILGDLAYTWRGYAFGHLLRDKFTFLFTRLFPQLIQFTKKIEDLLQSEKISQILVEEDVCIFNKTLVQVASLQNIPSVVIQHGFAVLKVGFSPLSASRFAAYGEAACRRLMEWGVPSEKITVTGNVLHDKIHDGIPSKEEFCSRLGLDPAKKIVLLGMFPYRDYSVADFPEVESYSTHYFRLIETTARALSGTDCQLIVKLHPRDSKLKECTAFMEKFPQIRSVVAQMHPSVHYAAHCDVLVTVLSTLLIDTLPFQKPMIVVDFSGQPAQKTQEMISMQIPVVPNHIDLLAIEIRKALEQGAGPHFAGMAQDHLYRLDGQASKRAAGLFSKEVPALQAR